jgi:ABC-type sulfate transport system permease component
MPPHRPRRAPPGASGASAVPGFGLSFGYAVAYLGLVVLLPLGALVLRASSLGLGGPCLRGETA